MNTKFFSLGPTWGKKWYWGQVKLDPNDRFFKKGMLDFAGVVEIEIDAGTTPSDFLWNSHNLIIASQKVIDLWKELGDFETYWVKIGGKASPAGYTGVVFLGKGGSFDPVRSKVVYSQSLNDEGKPAIMKIKGFYFDVSKWDGSNLFRVDGFPHLHLATEQVVRVMRKAKITNCYYQPLEEFRYGY